jgi:hypothetical protein
MRTFPQPALDSLVLPKSEGGVHHPPRAMMAWAHEGRFLDQPYREQPEDSGTTNHRIQRCAGWIVHTRGRDPRYVGWWIDQMGRWRREGEQLGEQDTDTYDAHYIGALVQVAALALAEGLEQLYAATAAALARWVSLRLLITDPRTLRSAGPGRRCGDPFGRSLKRDIGVCQLTRAAVPRGWRWPVTDVAMMEPHLVASLAPALPRLSRKVGALPVLEDRMIVQPHANGYAATTPVSTMRSGRGGSILWGVSHVYGSDEDHSYAGVGWRDLGLPYDAKEAAGIPRIGIPPNPRRPFARQMGGGPMPMPLPGLPGIGEPVGAPVVVESASGGGGEQPAPPPPKPQPKPPKPSAPARGRWSVAAGAAFRLALADARPNQPLIRAPGAELTITLRDTRTKEPRGVVARAVADPKGGPLVVAGAGSQRWLLDTVDTESDQPATLVVQSQGDERPLIFIRQHT